MSECQTCGGKRVLKHRSDMLTCVYRCPGCLPSSTSPEARHHLTALHQRLQQVTNYHDNPETERGQEDGCNTKTE